MSTESRPTTSDTTRLTPITAIAGRKLTKLAAFSLTQLARQVHASMARAHPQAGTRPFHTLYDGDVLYAVTTNIDDAGSTARVAKQRL